MWWILKWWRDPADNDERKDRREGWDIDLDYENRDIAEKKYLYVLKIDQFMMFLSKWTVITFFISCIFYFSQLSAMSIQKGRTSSNRTREGYQDYFDGAVIVTEQQQGANVQIRYPESKSGLDSACF